MNKQKLVEVGKEVLTDLDAKVMSDEIKSQLSYSISKRFLHAYYHLSSNGDYKYAYDSVNEVLEDAINSSAFFVSIFSFETSIILA